MISLFDQIIYSSDEFINSCEKILNNNSDDNQLISLLFNINQKMYNEIMANNDKYKINLNQDVILPTDWIHSLHNDSQYYSSIWSRVLSSDMYNEKIKNKTLDKQIGLELKESILKHGGTKPAYDMVCDYMKRKPAIDGFITMHDLDTEVEYSFFLTTEQIKTPLQQKIINNTNNTKPIVQNNKTNKTNNSSDDEFTNRFSEINESSVNFDEYQ